MRFVPVRAVAACADEGQVRPLHAARAEWTQRSAASVELVAREAIVALEGGLALVELREARHGEVRVASAAARVGVARGDHRLGPEGDVAVRRVLLRRASLSAVTGGAAHR